MTAQAHSLHDALLEIKWPKWMADVYSEMFDDEIGPLLAELERTYPPSLTWLVSM